MKKLYLILFLSLLHIRVGLCPNTTNQQKQRLTFLAEKHLFLKEVYNSSLTPELLKQALYYEEILHPDIVYRQILLETGYLTSDMLWRNNNLTGMRYARVRQTTAVKKVQGHAYYHHWFDAVKDYRYFQEWYIKRGYDLTDYLQFLVEIGYATDKNYISKLKSVC